MSVSVHKLVKNKVNFNNSPAHTTNSATITTISVTARIDYILRFSKQSVLVVDDDAALYSKVASQFLSTLTNKNNSHVNAAFVCASTQLNDIQMRCRLIEQLFADTLFDPEQSLVVSVLNLVKKQPQAITIVIEHAQSLSLQLKYELSQLAEAAKKTNNIIHVVMFGSIESGQQIVSEKSLFGSNLGIILADSGQVISINHKMFKNRKSFLTMSFGKTIAWTITTLSFGFLLWMSIDNYENLKFKVDEYVSLFIPDTVIVNDPTLVKENKIEQEDPSTLVVIKKETVQKEMLASYQDINRALLSSNISQPNTLTQDKLAQNNDVIKALSLTQSTSLQSLPPVTINKSKKDDLPKLSVLPNKEVVISLPLNANYYLAKQDGFIIQIAGFSDEFIFNQFIEEYAKVELYSYQRLLNQNPFTVLTSKVYPSKNDALRAINTLPKKLQERGLWVKSLDIVKKEINENTRS